MSFLKTLSWPYVGIVGFTVLVAGFFAYRTGFSVPHTSRRSLTVSPANSAGHQQRSNRPENQALIATRETSTRFGEEYEWILEPTYSSTEYDPSLASNPSYREQVVTHLFLEAFYQSPLRLKEAFSQTLSAVENWGVNPRQELKLVVQAHNIAWEHQILHRNFHLRNGNILSGEERSFNREKLKWNIHNLKKRFDLLFEGFPNARFRDLLKIEPEGQFVEPALQIAPGTRLISL